MENSRGLYLFREVEESSDDDSSDRVFDIEYAVIADAHIVGDFTWGSINFSVWQMGLSSDQERWLCLRVRYIELSDEERAASIVYPNKVSKKKRSKAFYHGGGVPEEIVTLATLFLRRRLKLGPTVRWRGLPRMFDESPKARHRQLTEGTSNLADLETWLNLVQGLQEELHLSFMLAARLYQEALLQIESKPDFAYLNLISAIEALSNRPSNVDAIIDDYDGDLAMLLHEVADEELRGKLQERILEHLNSGEIGLRFRKFIVAHVEESFWETERPEEGFGCVKPEQLDVLMKRVYDQRSKTLHEGRPFPPWIFHQSVYDEEMPLALGVSHAEGVWSQDDFFPLPHFMERLTRHVLITFLRRNQKSEKID
jgi:hypothetical protein